MTESFRLSVTCTRQDRADGDAGRHLLAEHDVGVVETHEFDREMTYVSEAFADTAANREQVEALSAIRETLAENEIKRDKQNSSPQTLGIENVSYVTSIIAGVGDD